MPDLADPHHVASQYGDTSRLAARHRLHAEFTVAAEPLHDWLFEREAPRPGERVLDIGCGPGGMWARHAADLAPGARLVLADSSAAMVAAAAEATADLPAAVVRADAGRLPFADAAFDVCVANHMLYHVADRAAALAELRRVLRGGGRFFASTNGARHMRELDALVPAPRPPIGFSLESAAAELAEVFAGVALARHPEELRITEPEPAVDYLASYHDLTVEDRRRITAAVEAGIARRGWFRVTKDVGLFSARRA